jgi:hypothetical protein
MGKKILKAENERLQLLKRASQKGLPARIGPRNPELSVCAELVDSGHLDGWVIVEDQKLREILHANITPLGEEYLEQFNGVQNNSLWNPAPRSPSRLLVGLGLLLTVVLLLISVCQGRDGQIVDAPSEPTTYQHSAFSSPRLFGVCGAPPVE